MNKPITRIVNLCDEESSDDDMLLALKTEQEKCKHLCDDDDELTQGEDPVQPAQAGSLSDNENEMKRCEEFIKKIDDETDEESDLFRGPLIKRTKSELACITIELPYEMEDLAKLELLLHAHRVGAKITMANMHEPTPKDFILRFGN